jgi:MinD superfamily P-loop ATPase
MKQVVVISGKGGIGKGLNNYEICIRPCAIK